MKQAKKLAWQALRRRLGGQVAPVIDGKLHFLVRCHLCERVFLHSGNKQLTLSEEVKLLWVLQLQIGNLHRLPRQLCEACQLVKMGGFFRLTEDIDLGTGAIGGYCAMWDQVEPSPLEHLLVGVVFGEGLVRPDTLSNSGVTNVGQAYQILHYLTSMSTPQEYLAKASYTSHAPSAPSDSMSSRSVEDETWPWTIFTWLSDHPQLGPLTIIFGQSSPVWSEVDLPTALARWQELATAYLRLAYGSPPARSGEQLPAR